MKRKLMLEVSPIVQQQLSGWLAENEDLEIIACSTHEEAEALLRLRRPDLYLLEAGAEPKAAFEKIRRLRSSGQTESLAILLMLEEDRPELQEEAIDVGADDILVKPLARLAVCRRISALMELHAFHEAEDREVERRAGQQIRQLQRMSAGILKSFADAVDAKNEYTRGHSARVARYAMEIARRAGYQPLDLERVFRIGMMHDIGKIGIPEEIINKPGKLSDEEYEVMKTHTLIGYNILHTNAEFEDMARGARSHHERYDGRGYPDGLAGTDIPEIARIITVADSYDAMASNRSYRRAMTQAAVREQIAGGIGTQLDPAFARIMLKMIDEDVNYQMREQKDAPKTDFGFPHLGLLRRF